MQAAVLPHQPATVHQNEPASIVVHMQEEHNHIANKQQQRLLLVESNEGWLLGRHTSERGW